jgi:outer membrane protein insertion porin family
MRTLTLLCLILCVSFSFSQQALAGYILQDSKIPVIEKITQKYKGQSLSLYQIDQILRELAQDGIFQVLYAEQLPSGKVVIRAEESVRVLGINITGESSFDEEEIIKTMEIPFGQNMSQLEIQQSIDKVKDLYKESGFYNFEVNFEKQIVENGVVLNIQINEQDFCLIEDIKIYSKNDFLNKQIQVLIPQFLNQNYKTETATEIIKKINEVLLKHRFLTGKVENTSTIFNQSKTRVKLKYTIENTTQFEFVFHGNHFFTHFDLLDKSEIGSKFLYLSDSGSDIKDTIVDLYLQNGFPQVAVSVSENVFPDMQKKVYVFDIREGPRIRIGEIEIVGKISREQPYYIELFNSYLDEEEHSLFFVRKNIENAAEKMIVHLKREGHLLAELLSIHFDITARNDALVTIQIDEGLLTYVRQVLFRGAKSFSNIELKQQVKIETNKPLNIQQVEDSFELLENFYKERAYIEFRVKNKNASVIQYKKGQPYADIVYEVSEGPKISVKAIKVNGLSKTKEYVVVRELDFKVGELLTISKVNNSITRLERTGLFGKVNIRSLEKDLSRGDRTIIVDVEERKPGLFSTGVGLNNEGGLLTSRGYLGALYNNISGKARGISARVELTYRDRVEYPENRIAVTYFEPFLFEDRVRARVSLVREQQLFDIRNAQNPVIQTTNELRFSTEKEFSKHFRFTYNVWGFSNEEYFGVKDSINNDAFSAFRVQNIATTGPIFELDYRDDPFVPKSGSYSRLEVEYADPILGSSRDNPNLTGRSLVVNDGVQAVRYEDNRIEINYYRATFQTNHYIPLTKSKRWVWATSLQGGYVKNVSNREDSGIPQVRSFLLGGPSTVRGFFSVGGRESIPGVKELCIKQGLTGDDCSLANTVVRDESAFGLFKTELRFPISGNWGGLLFYDAGLVHISDFALEDPFRDAIGLGISYDTPVGSFLIQVGYKLDRKRESVYFQKEDAIAIHLAIGSF